MSKCNVQNVRGSNFLPKVKCVTKQHDTDRTDKSSSNQKPTGHTIRILIVTVKMKTIMQK